MQLKKIDNKNRGIEQEAQKFPTTLIKKIVSMFFQCFANLLALGGVIRGMTKAFCLFLADFFFLNFVKKKR